MDNINPWLEKIKPVIGPLNLVLVAALGFGLGRWSKIEEQREPVLIENSTTSDNVTTKSQGQVVGSKNGNKYHYPWCSGAQRIKEENKIWFTSVDEAKKAGYTPAANCPGL
ncbi:MAG: hypothetical protein AAB505_01380 [Patescibacteria group bacterium]